MSAQRTTSRATVERAASQGFAGPQHSIRGRVRTAVRSRWPRRRRTPMQRMARPARGRVLYRRSAQCVQEHILSESSVDVQPDRAIGVGRAGSNRLQDRDCFPGAPKAISAPPSGRSSPVRGGPIRCEGVRLAPCPALAPGHGETRNTAARRGLVRIRAMQVRHLNQKRRAILAGNPAPAEPDRTPASTHA